jgi:hypothetical protein
VAAMSIYRVLLDSLFTAFSWAGEIGLKVT